MEGPPAFSAAFSPDLIATGGSSLLTFTIDNSAKPPEPPKPEAPTMDGMGPGMDPGMDMMPGGEAPPMM